MGHGGRQKGKGKIFPDHAGLHRRHLKAEGIYLALFVDKAQEDVFEGIVEDIFRKPVSWTEIAPGTYDLKDAVFGLAGIDFRICLEKLLGRCSDIFELLLCKLSHWIEF